MYKNIFYIGIIMSLFFLFFSCGKSSGISEEKIGEGPKIPFHIEQADIKNYSIEELIGHGELLFSLSFNELDGLGRPESSGTAKKRSRRESPQNFNRISGPDANSCVACHNLPRVGGGGDNSNNVFGLASDVDFATLEGSVGSEDDSSSVLDITNERNTVGIFGDGLVELLAREITYDLLQIVDDAREYAEENNTSVRKELNSKGINFGYITAHNNGFIDTSELDGIDNDFIVRPFIQKGVIASLRDFSNISMNHHHGMQSEELVGNNSDSDRDGVINELTEGDITAITLFQATLDYPKRKISSNPMIKESQNKGEAIFEDIGCSSCHVSSLPLKSLKFVEPGPFNTEKSTTLSESNNNLVVDLEEYVSKLEKDKDGNYLIPLYSDLKRHDMGQMLDNERPLQKGVPTNYWLTKKLWGFYSEPPFLHHGRSNLLVDVIEMHQGDAKISSDAFFELSETEKVDLLEFLKSFK
ncbi:MAG: di-heme oxidoredictase family protein [Chloroflexota bacterium]|nr:di-heme oxidoredictase family protein [Chloroflexota bacterium]